MCLVNKLIPNDHEVSHRNNMFKFATVVFRKCHEYQYYRETAYTTLIRPGLEYCDTIWDPHTKADAALLDQVQNRASRWAKGKSKFEACSVSALQRELGWLPLAEWRQHHRLSIMYKIRNGLLAVEPEAVDLVPNSRPGKQSQYNTSGLLCGIWASQFQFEKIYDRKDDQILAFWILILDLDVFTNLHEILN